MTYFCLQTPQKWHSNQNHCKDNSITRSKSNKKENSIKVSVYHLVSVRFHKPDFFITYFLFFIDGNQRICYFSFSLICLFFSFPNLSFFFLVCFFFSLIRLFFPLICLFFFTLICLFFYLPPQCPSLQGCVSSMFPLQSWPP